MAGHFAGGTGGGIHRDDRRQWVSQGVYAGIAVKLPFVGSRDTNPFTAVMRATAADGDDNIALFLTKDRQAIAHVGVFWIWLDAIKNHHLNTGFLQIAESFIHRAVFDGPQTFIGDQQRFFTAQQLTAFADDRNSIGTKKVHVWHQIIKHTIAHNISSWLDLLFRETLQSRFG